MKQRITIHASQGEIFFKRIIASSDEIGMKVNENKTQLLCISASNESTVSFYIKLLDGSRIQSGDDLKILGFYFDSKPSVAYHIEKLRAGLSCDDLVKCFNTLVCPILEYSAVVFPPMLSAEMSNKLEKIQCDAFKAIYGFEKSYEEILSSNDLMRLDTRRSKLFDDFVQKMSLSDRFSRRWFPTKDFVHYDLRKEKIFEEKHACTARLYNSPLYAMRRRLNEISPVTLSE